MVLLTSRTPTISGIGGPTRVTSLEIIHIRADLIAKIRAAARTRPSHLGPDPKKPSRSLSVSDRAHAAPAIVAIGLSTGGPKALEQILPCFPAELPVPLLIVQHMPVGFVHSFAQRLNQLSSIEVCEASHRDLMHPGVAYIAPAGIHMRVDRRLSDLKATIALDRRPSDAEHVPSVDVMMKSVAQVFRHRAVGVIMTGMGSDGAEGMAEIFRQGGSRSARTKLAVPSTECLARAQNVEY